jgi:hypothetical protein
MPGSGSTEIGGEPRCCLCGTGAELSYCTFCSKYFCAACERNYPARVIAATLEGFTTLKTLLLSAIPADLAEPAVPPKKPPLQRELCCGSKHRE